MLYFAVALADVAADERAAAEAAFRAKNQRGSRVRVCISWVFCNS
jgi:hypothetical protein